MESKVKTVLITGGTSGIGLELAKLFAKDRYKMVLVARHEDTLNQTSSLLKSLGAQEVTVIARDLSIPGQAREVFEETERRGIEVNVLVNDAGVGERGLFVENDLEKELSIINLNIVALVELTKHYLKKMVAGNEGRILQLGSVASYQPTPKLAVYAATKAFVLSFTDAIINELKDSAVKMTLLIPGPTDTDFFNKANAENTKAAQDDPEDPAVVAKIGYDAMVKGQHHAVAPGMSKHIVMSSTLPNEVVSEMAGMFMKEKEESKK